jgi:hypothetical protein
MNSKIHKIYFEPTTKVIVSGGYEGSSTNGWVQGFDTLFWDDNRINALSNAATVNPIILSATLAQTFNNRSSRIDWCGNYRHSPCRTFHSSRRSGGIFGTFFLQKKD